MSARRFFVGAPVTVEGDVLVTRSDRGARDWRQRACRPSRIVMYVLSRRHSVTRSSDRPVTGITAVRCLAQAPTLRRDGPQSSPPKRPIGGQSPVGGDCIVKWIQHLRTRA